MSEKILIISGPTASGKSDLALRAADLRDIAIINADSLQIYEGLPVLSSQPIDEEKKKVQHLFYSHFKPQESCSVATWLQLVKSRVEELWAQKKLPVIVGGNGMYISKLVDGISEIPQVLEATRKLATEEYEKIGHAEFQKKIFELTQEKFLDKQRLIRAYEVLLQTKKPISFWQNQPKKIFPNANFIHVNFDLPREKLYENCNLRFEKMLKTGAIEEVQNLVNCGVGDDLQISKTLGFSEIRDFLSGKISQQKTIEIATQKTRNYAKRQLTWFRNQLPQKHVFRDSAAALNFLKNEI